jgi:predicted ATP-dependent endonuclease of OLD family
MQKIIINNFGAVKSAEIDIKKVLILIGEQASGKSTIAKLIYFFRSLRDDLIIQVFKDVEKGNFDEKSDFLEPLCDKFYNLFGSTYHLPSFEITFYYSFENDKYIRLTLNKNKELALKLSDNFFDDKFNKIIDGVRILERATIEEQDLVTRLLLESSKAQSRIKVYNCVQQLFEINQEENVFIVAGRTATVSYSELFENYLFSNIIDKLKENSAQSLHLKTPTIDSELMFNFIKRVIEIKKQMKGQDATPHHFRLENKYKKQLELIRNQIILILKGKYEIDSSGEKIILGEKDNLKSFVYLSNASSGQQEVVRILQDLLLIILKGVKTSRIIEEPEAHLFPIAQKQLVELFALMVNQDIDNQLIITTHSPYILAAFNNLLFAKRVIEKNPNAEKEVSEIVAPEFRLDSNEFAAYSLSHSEDYDYCTSIMSDRGLISENYLDTVSDILSEDFEVLYDIHSKTYARK